MAFKRRERVKVREISLAVEKGAQIWQQQCGKIIAMKLS